MSRSKKKTRWIGQSKDQQYKRMHHRINRRKSKRDLIESEPDAKTDNHSYKVQGVDAWSICDYGWFYSDEHEHAAKWSRK